MIPVDDLLTLSLIALGVTLAVTAASVVVLLALRRTSIIVQACVVVTSTILSIVLSMIAAANAMFLSAHELSVAVNIAVISGAVSLVLVAVLGWVVVRNSRALSRDARRIGDGELVENNGRRVNLELSNLASELSATSAKLADAREREELVQKSRRELIAWISHDLRTPLAGIRAMAEALEDFMVEDPPTYYGRIREQAERLSIMVDDLFELSKIDAGTFTLTLQSVSLYDVVSDTVADLRTLSRGREIDFQAAPGQDLSVTADPRALSRAVGNLLLNAIQHTPAGSPITVTVEIVDGQARVAVIDRGGGISERDLTQIFEPGWRGSAARTPHPSASGGAGLGLAIVRGIAAAHSGEVSVCNVPGGCRFDLVIPRNLAAGV